MKDTAVSDWIYLVKSVSNVGGSHLHVTKYDMERAVTMISLLTLQLTYRSLHVLQYSCTSIVHTHVPVHIESRMPGLDQIILLHIGLN